MSVRRLRPCVTCATVTATTGPRCAACARYWTRHRAARPAWMWGEATRVAPPRPVAPLDVAPAPDDPPRVRLAFRFLHAAWLQEAL